MCGPFVLAQVSSRLQAVRATQMCERHRVTHGLLLPYHLGRMVTYAGLGAVMAQSGSMLGGVPGLRLLPTVLLLSGACLFALAAFRRIWLPGVASRLRWPRVALPWVGVVAAQAARIDATRPLGAFVLGAVLGFLPCGLLYAALALAGTAGSAALGALAMLAFGMGTVPSLAILGIAGQLGVRQWSSVLGRVGPPMLLLSALMLVVMAWQIS